MLKNYFKLIHFSPRKADQRYIVLQKTGDIPLLSENEFYQKAKELIIRAAYAFGYDEDHTELFAKNDDTHTIELHSDDSYICLLDLNDE